VTFETDNIVNTQVYNCFMINGTISF